MLKRAFVVIACGFASRDKLCNTTLARIRVAISLASKKDPTLKRVLFVATGNVFREPGGFTLAQLQIIELVNRWKIPESDVLVGKGVGMFSESRIVPEQIRAWQPDAEVVTVISSDWYFQREVKKLWKRNIKEQGFEAEIWPLYGTGGWKTKAKYFVVYGIMLSACALLDRILIPVFGVSAINTMDTLLTKKQETRKTKGFKFKCCE